MKRHTHKQKPRQNANSGEKKKKVPSNMLGESLFICMYKYEELKGMNSPKANSHCSFPSDLSGTTSRSSIGKFLGAAHLLKTQWDPLRGTLFSRPSPSLYCSSRQQYFSDGRINSYLCLCTLPGPPDS